MAEEEEECAEEQGDFGDGGEELDLTDDSAGVARRLCEVADEAVEEELVGIVKDFRVNVREKRHMVSAKTLLDLAAKLEKLKKQAAKEKYESLAKVLWRAVQKLGPWTRE